MLLHTDELTPQKCYHLLTQTVIPRPIAWVLTDNGIGEGQGRYNLAPYSFFNAVSANPPLLMLSIAKKRTQEDKDTLKNILERKNAVVHIASFEHMAQVEQTSVEFPFGDSELTHGNFALQQEEGWWLPRLAACNVAFNCKYHSHVQPEEKSPVILFLMVKDVFINDDICDAERISAVRLDPLARLGQQQYAGINRITKQGF